MVYLLASFQCFEHAYKWGCYHLEPCRLLPAQQPLSMGQCVSIEGGKGRPQEHFQVTMASNRHLEQCHQSPAGLPWDWFPIVMYVRTLKCFPTILMQPNWKQPAGVMTLDGNFDLHNLRHRQQDVRDTLQMLGACLVWLWQGSAPNTRSLPCTGHAAGLCGLKLRIRQAHARQGGV